MGKLGEKIKNVVGDVGKFVAKQVAAPLNAITGHEFNPTMKTQLGNKLERVADFTEDVIQNAGNTATFGLGKKLGVFDGENETKAGTLIGKVAGVVGLAAATVATAGAVGGAGFTVAGGVKVAKSVVEKVVEKAEAKKLVQKMDEADMKEGLISKSESSGIFGKTVEAVTSTPARDPGLEAVGAYDNPEIANAAGASTSGQSQGFFGSLVDAFKSDVKTGVANKVVEVLGGETAVKDAAEAPVAKAGVDQGGGNGGMLLGLVALGAAVLLGRR